MQPKLSCPSCGKHFVADRQSAVMPFCSERCKMADLNSWFKEDMGLPYVPSADEIDAQLAELERLEAADGDEDVRSQWRF